MAIEPSTSISVIVSVSEFTENTVSLYPEYRQAINNISDNYELIYAVSGEFKEIISQLTEIAKTDPKVKVIALSRDYGEGTLIQAAFDHASGDLALLLPPYKQINLNELPKLFEHIENNDIVLAKRWPRRDNFAKQLQTKLFNGVIYRLIGQRYSDTGCHIRLFKQEVTKELKLYGDQHRFSHLLAHELGFTACEVDVEQAEENIDRSYHSPGIYLRRLLDLITIVFLTKFNKKPLRFFGILGSASIAMGATGLFFMCLQKVFYDVAMADRPLLVLLSLFLVLGIQLIGIGLIGETIIFTHAGDKKEYRIRKIVN